MDVGMTNLVIFAGVLLVFGLVGAMVIALVTRRCPRGE